MSLCTTRWVPTNENVKHVMCQTLNLSLHHPIDLDATEVGKWVKKHQEFLMLGERKLFMYYSKAAGNFVIARWLSPTAGTFQDVLILGRSPRMFAGGDQKLLFQSVRPPNYEAMMALLEQSRQREMARNCKLQDRNDRQVHARRQLIKPKTQLLV